MRSLTLALLFLALTAFPGSGAFGNVKSVKILYVTLGEETTFAVTTSSIEQRSYHAEILNTDPTYIAIMKIINDAFEGNFDEYRVRVRIVDENGEYIYVDNDGGVKTIDGSYKLSHHDLAKLKTMLESFVQPR